MNDPKIPSSSLTRRGFMKNSALTVGAITMLSQGIALATNGSGTSGSGGMEPAISKSEYEVTIDGPAHNSAKPNEENFRQHEDYDEDRDAAERSWPENRNPENQTNARWIDHDYILVPSPVPDPTLTITTSPSIDDVVPQIVNVANSPNQWHFRWVFKSVMTYDYN